MCINKCKIIFTHRVNLIQHEEILGLLCYMIYYFFQYLSYMYNVGEVAVILEAPFQDKLIKKENKYKYTF